MSELECFLWKVESFTSSAASRGSSRSSTVALLGNFSQSVNGELRTATDVNASLCVCTRVCVCVCTWPCLQIHRERAATRTITSTRRTVEREREKRASCLCYLHVSRSRPADKQSTQHTQSEGSERASTVREGRGERLETTWTRFARVFLAHNEKHCKRTALPDFT